MWVFEMHFNTLTQLSLSIKTLKMASCEWQLWKMVRKQWRDRGILGQQKKNILCFLFQGKKKTDWPFRDLEVPECVTLYLKQQTLVEGGKRAPGGVWAPSGETICITQNSENSPQAKWTYDRDTGCGEGKGLPMALGGGHLDAWVFPSGC